MCEHRYDYKLAPFYQKFFLENYDLFELAYLTEVNGKRFLFSHAGISKYWLKNNVHYFGADISDPEKVLARLDNGLRILAQIGYGRGGSVARVAKEAFEEQTGKKVVSSLSMKQYLESQQPKLDLEDEQ